MSEVKRLLQKGDLIQCHDVDDLITTMQELENEGVSVDFNYDRPGYWLEVVKTEVTK